VFGWYCFLILHRRRGVSAVKHSVVLYGLAVCGVYCTVLRSARRALGSHTMDRADRQWLHTWLQQGSYQHRVVAQNFAQTALVTVTLFLLLLWTAVDAGGVSSRQPYGVVRVTNLRQAQQLYVGLAAWCRSAAAGWLMEMAEAAAALVIVVVSAHPNNGIIGRLYKCWSCGMHFYGQGSCNFFEVWHTLPHLRLMCRVRGWSSPAGHGRPSCWMGDWV